MAALSIVFSVVTLLSFWLILPIYVRPPLAFVLGYLSYRNCSTGGHLTSSRKKLVATLPMLIAVLSLVLCWYFVDVGYTA